LWDVSITDLGIANVFFGENNSGKSNILEALEILFKVEQKELPVSGFYRGELSNFVDNFTVKSDGTVATTINISCKVAIGSEDTAKIPVFIEFMKQNSILKKRNQWLQLDVEIKPVTSRASNKMLKKATINDDVMYDSSVPQPGSFFPELSGRVDQEASQNAAEELFLYIINSFDKIHTGRFMETRKVVESSGMDVSMHMQQFKDWFRTLIESRGEDYRTFQKIQGWFKEKPFAYGTIRPISSQEKTELIIEDMSGRELLLERLGTGVQQILILLSQIAARVSGSKTKIFGIEELELNLSPNMQRETLNMLAQMGSTPDTSGFSQIFLTSHSPYLCNRDYAELYAVSIDDTTGTQVIHGVEATRKLAKHFKYDDFNLSRRSELRK
jgi:predicted ATP-dependent endonuclease of OLD family